GQPARQALRVWAGTDDGDRRRVLAAAPDGDVPVGLVGRDNVVRAPVGPALERAQPAVRQLRAARKTGLIQFRAQVMMVEYELRAINSSVKERDWPEDVRRVTR